ncbi:MAG TPA: DUF475 domain-containing protein [Actinocrinis sp.]|uniref:DUF475 domain-containing protein n=1 Tax=Actinocrinis sp. TaxID=1920516 RepID=UPI002DDD2B6D|nr:DUF475 domain-containing protein [Actinocrinis sp.]HEV2346130.1 DUF475 domain-containing protein [Actinocrinis sp.]
MAGAIGLSKQRGGLRVFGVAHLVAIGCLTAAYMIEGVHGLAVAALLGVLEVAVSFDNAIVNATVLARMGLFWQRMFLSMGIVVAAIGMRLLVPLAIVSIGARMSPTSAIDLAYSNPERYHQLLLAVQPGIAAFGGAFLLMIFLGFVFEERDDVWVGWFERPLRRLGRMPHIGEVLVLAFAVIAAGTVDSTISMKVVVGAVAGLGSFLLVNGISQLIAEQADADGASRPRATVNGKGAFFLFCYLELLDATFSFDSVMGAFSVTLDISLITIGLAIGAAYIRALTVYVVRRGTLDQYRYLEHGAYYAIGMLAVLLMVEVWRDVPDVLTAGAGAALIIAAVASSLAARRRQDLARRRGQYSDGPDAEVHAGPGHIAEYERDRERHAGSTERSGPGAGTRATGSERRQDRDADRERERARERERERDHHESHQNHARGRAVG